MARRLSHLNPKKTLFLLCDIQEKFRPAMPLFNNLIENAKRLTTAGKVLDVPLLVTEQNPDKLGNTVEDLDICHAKSVSHVCVEQTAIDLLAKNINVFVVADCVASRVHQDRDMALERLRSAGCVITTTESIIYDLLHDKDHPKFKDLRKILIAKSLDMEINKTPKAKL
ncbi:isochorismatase domain-containing protein 1-like isoform 2-T2 [Cochliomyia hominivorax]